MREEAFKTVEISSGTDWPAKVPLHLPDDDERIVNIIENSKDEDDLTRSKRPFVKQGPTRAYCVRDVIIADGAILTTGSFENLRPERRRFMLNGPIEHYGERTLCSTWITEKYWGHWLKDVFCHELLAAQLGAEPLVLPNQSRFHEDGYRAILDMPANSVRVAHVEKLWLLEDYEINAGRVERLEKVGDKLRKQHESPGPSHVYIKRGVTGIGRKLLNEFEIIEALEARGFTILAPEEMDAEAIVAALRSAKMVVGVEGSAISHATVTMPSGGGQVVIEPPERFNMLSRTFCAALGQSLGYTVGDPGGDHDFSQPIDRLLRVIDMMNDEIEH